MRGSIGITRPFVFCNISLRAKKKVVHADFQVDFQRVFCCYTKYVAPTQEIIGPGPASGRFEQ